MMTSRYVVGSVFEDSKSALQMGFQGQQAQRFLPGACLSRLSRVGGSKRLVGFRGFD